MYGQKVKVFQINFSLQLFHCQVVGLNFSSATTPELMLKTFDHYCEYRRTPNGVVLSPVQLGKWLVVFCDEINLPDMDRYGEYFHYSGISVGWYRKLKEGWASFTFQTPSCWHVFPLVQF